MRANVFSSDKKNKYEEALGRATEKTPISIFDTPEGKKGIYVLDDNVARTFLLSEVARKKRELSERDSSGCSEREDV